MFTCNEHKELFQHIKFVVQGDDDTYIRPDQVLRWLAVVDKTGLDDIPIIANSSPYVSDRYGVWHINPRTYRQGR